MLKNIFLSEKKLLNAILRASKNTNLCFSANKQIMRMRGTDAQKLLSQWEKVLNAILRAKLKHMKMFLSNEMNSFCNAEDRFSWVWAIFQKKSFRA